MSIVSIIIILLGAMSFLSILVSLWGIGSALLDKKILDFMGVDDARTVVVGTHLRNALSRLLQGLGLLSVAGIVWGLPVPPQPIETYEAIALGILTLSSVNITINYILDEHDRKEIIKKDDLYKESQGADVATAEGDGSKNTAIATSK